jgi:ABC-type Co2+ transport system permease subunit
MSIMNRRYAILGWSVWQIAKQVAKRKARAAAPGTGDHAGLNKAAIAGILAAVVGALLFWRHKADGEPTA